MQQDLMPGLGTTGGGPRSGQIKIHGADAFEGMRRAGELAAATLDFITPYVRPGVTTGELDRLCHGFIIDHDAIPAPLNYRGFPKSIGVFQRRPKVVFTDDWISTGVITAPRSARLAAKIFSARATIERSVPVTSMNSS